MIRGLKFKPGEKVVVDGTLRVTVLMQRVDGGKVIVETGHGSLEVEPERLERLA
jgi:hypothetical protein